MKNRLDKTTAYILLSLALSSCRSSSDNQSDIINFDPADINDGWAISTAAEQGLDTERIEDLYGEAGPDA